jgi:YD repeat-containing protein
MPRYTAPGSHRRAFEFADDGRVTALTDAQGRTTRFEYTRYGTLIGWTGPGGTLHECSHFTFIILFEGGRPCAAIDPRGGLTRLEYDAQGRPWRRTEPDGEFTQAAEGRALALPRWARILWPVVGSEEDSLIAVADPDGVFFPRDTLRLPPRDDRTENTGAATTSRYVYQFDGSRLEPGPEADPTPAAVAVG